MARVIKNENRGQGRGTWRKSWVDARRFVGGCNLDRLWSEWSRSPSLQRNSYQLITSWWLK